MSQEDYVAHLPTPTSSTPFRSLSKSGSVAHANDSIMNGAICYIMLVESMGQTQEKTHDPIQDEGHGKMSP